MSKWSKGAAVKKLGEDHPDTLLARKDLAWSYQEARRFQKAEPLCRELVRVVGRGKPRNDPLYCESLALLGRCLSLQQNHDEGVSVLGECLTIAEKTQPDDWTTASYRSVLGEAPPPVGAHSPGPNGCSSPGIRGWLSVLLRSRPIIAKEALRRARQSPGPTL